jgi:hypothetical protein
MKCVRLRCQLAPGSVAAIASTSPGVRVRSDQLDADEAARDQRAQEGQPRGPIFAGDDVKPERELRRLGADHH